MKKMCIHILKFYLLDVWIDYYVTIYNFADVPSAPEGPIEVTDLTEKTAMLSWKPPKSDGGLPLSGYIIERRDNKRTDWVKVNKLSPETTTYKANNMLEGNLYNYRVMAENEEGVGPALETKDSIKPTKQGSK